ncbi:MAG: hypothetical protein M1483_01870 [Actinobacteria bacterium]|nr:hypothetical protein [Actinomycetota bacterium]
MENIVDRRKIANMQSAEGFNYNYARITAGWARIWLVIATVLVIAVAGGLISQTALQGHTRKTGRPPTPSSIRGNVRTGTILKSTKLQSGVHLAVQMLASAPVLLGDIARQDAYLSLLNKTPTSVNYFVTVRNYGNVPLTHTILNVSVTPPPAVYSSYNAYNAPGISVSVLPNEVPATVSNVDWLYCPHSYIPASGKIACRMKTMNSLMDPGATLRVEFTIGFGQLSSSQPVPPPSVTMTAAVTATTRSGKAVKSTALPVSTKIVPADVNTTLQVTTTMLPELSPSAKFPALEVTLTNHSSTEPIYQVFLTAPGFRGPPGEQHVPPGANDFPRYVCQGEPLGDITEMCVANPSAIAATPSENLPATLAPGASVTMVFGPAGDFHCASPSNPYYPNYQAVGVLASGKIVYASYC